MNKIIDFYHKNYRLFLVFLFSFIVIYFLGFYINNGDPTATFGFSHAISHGEIIYRDFNTISTPLYAFYIAFFLLFWDNYMMVIIAQCILITVMFYFLFKLFDRNAWIVFLAMIIPKFFGFNETYNFCCLAMSVIVLYLEEKYPKKDYLIGFFLGLMFLSKQTVGGLFVLPTLILYYKDIKKIIKRVIGFSLPCIVLVIYLLISGAMYSFLDLCFFGLFDFGSNNSVLFTPSFFFSMIVLVISILLFIFDRKKLDIYGLLYLGFVLPIFDLAHFAFYFTGFSIMLLFHIKKKIPLLLIIGVILEFTLFNTFMALREDRPIIFKDLKHFEYRYNYEIDYNNVKKYEEFIDKYVDYDPIVIMYLSMIYNVSHDREITYFDIFLYGNHGYHGTDKMIDKISKMHQKYFIINLSEYEASQKNNDQFNAKIVDYILDHSEKFDCYYNVCVYYKK